MLTVKDIMTENVITIRPEATVEELARLLIEHRISGVPVVDSENNLLGVVTEKDLINQNKRLHIPTVIRLFDAYFVLGTGKTEEEIKKMVATTVNEIYIKEVVSVNEENTLQEVATIMSEKSVHTLPVVRDRRVVGIIGKADIVKAMTRNV
jgi:CBS-domain-containing membrane protein